MKLFIPWCIIWVLCSFFWAGCTSTRVDESKLPWARPANWEGAPPGMSGLPGMSSQAGSRNYPELIGSV